MKKLLFGIISLFVYMSILGQENVSTTLQKDVYNPLSGSIDQAIDIPEINNEKYDLKLREVPADCNTDFWTTNNNGYIQQWSLVNDSVIGGDTISIEGGNSIAYCGIESPIFYNTFYPGTGIYYYDSDSNWTHIPTSFQVLNNGGHKGDQYFMGYFDESNTVLYYLDGTNLITIDSLTSEQFIVADIAVDTMGRAWLFTGVDILNMTHLNVYNSTGLIASYTISYNSNNCYGSFFLNETLYVGFGSANTFNRNTIIPIIIDENEASLGTPIPFQDYGYADMASCQHVQASAFIDHDIYNNQNLRVKTSPNPFTRLTTLSYSLKHPSIVQLSVFNQLGQLVYQHKEDQQQGSQQLHWQTEDQPNGIYFYQLQAGDQVANGKMVKVN